ncbi:trithorax group protein osa-like [Asparagus officinalis]|uniref:trithorax group protein osa-like n=1 Tax=Asparagus officinalis TaxID=4686 RepID=UPI00098DF3EB|nr:trithorax group protein osa-like [Asparagus officinalis]
MGYDNECIVNIQSLPGEYFCPVCRTLVNPSESLQAQCTHLYCKPCLAYLVATTPACPYDGYLVTEADAKPLTESSKELAETIGKVAVYCLYHRSSCQWQGTLAESSAHCAGCSFGNSPVVCNRCGTQIVHRQVQEHALICPGVQPQAQAGLKFQVQATPDRIHLLLSSSCSCLLTFCSTQQQLATPAAPSTKLLHQQPDVSSGPTLIIPAAATPALLLLAAHNQARSGSQPLKQWPRRSTDAAPPSVKCHRSSGLRSGTSPRPHKHPPQTHPIQQQPPMQMQPQPQSHPHPQMQPPQPHAHPVSGYQSYPQPTLGVPQQQPPMHMHPQHPPQSQGQFPPQPPQMRPPHSQMMMPPQGPPANLHPMQQHPIQQPGQQVYPQPSFPQGQPQAPFHPGQQPQQVPPQHQPVPQSPGTGSNLMQPSINQQPLNQNYSGRVNQSGPIQQSQAPHGGKQGGASPATPKQEDGLVVKNAEGTKSGEKSTEHVSDTMSKSNEEKTAADAKDKDSQAENENKDVPENIVKDEIVDGQLVKKEEDTNLVGGLTEGSYSRKGREGKFDDKSSAQLKGEGVPEGQNAGNISSMLSQQMQATHALDRGQLQQQSAHQSGFPAQGRAYPPTGQGMPPGPPKQLPYGHQPHMSDPGMISQRPPVPDGMFQQPIHQSSQERRFPEPSPQVPVHGQAMLPSQMRPPVHNVHETFPQQRQMPVVQEACWPPPHAGPPGPRLPPPPPPPPGGAPHHHGIPPKGFDQQAMARPVMGGPPPGALDAPNRMMAGHSFTSEDKMGRSASFNAMEAEAHASRRPGVYDGRQPDTHRPLPNEHAPYGHPNAMKMNGMTNNAAVGGMHESEDRFRPLPDERFKPFPEGGFKAAHDEHFRPSSLDPARHVNRREFEEDLKQFPRPAHLDGEGPPRFDGYPTSRPLDRMAQQSGGANAFRPPSSYQSGAPFPPRFGNSESPLDIAREHLGRRHDGNFPHPDRLNLVPEFDRPPLRSPGHFSRDMPDGLPTQLRRGLDGIGPVNHGLPNDMRGNEIMGPRDMPSFRGSGFGGFHNHPDIAETGGLGNFPSHLRMGDAGFNGRFSSASREGNIDSFEQSRKRKAGGMVRCLICKIDCETVEGLEAHSQGREHQKKAMDMVLSIKKENAKKHRASANAAPFEDANKPRKSGFDKRAKRQ